MSAFSFLLALLGCTNKENTFDWKPTESGPGPYPMQVIRGSFVYGEDDEGYANIPNLKTLELSWGHSISSHNVGDPNRPPPHHLEITFFSYTENTFYQGSFELPKEHIFDLFKQGHYSPKKKNHDTYEMVMAGIAPGGIVSVWLLSADVITQVFYGKADKADISWAALTDNTSLTREEYVRLVLEDSPTPEALKKGIPFDLWDRYQKTYSWHLDFNSTIAPNIVHEISFVNGEKIFTVAPFDVHMLKRPRTAPKEIYLFWRMPDQSKRVTTINFNEEKMMRAFEAIQNLEPKTPIRLEVTPDESTRGKALSIALVTTIEKENLEKIEEIEHRVPFTDFTHTSYSAAKVDEEQFAKPNTEAIP